MGIINIATARTLTPKRKQPGCRCYSVTVDEQTRMLECDKCHRVIDPFDFLFEWAKREQSNVFNINQRRREIKRLGEEIAELKRQRRNLKAQVARLKSKATT